MNRQDARMANGRRQPAGSTFNQPADAGRSPLASRRFVLVYLSYFAVSSPASPCFLRLDQLYLRWNFSTRPVVSTYFILPVKNGWQAEQISTVMFFLVLRVTNLLPQPHVTVASTYSGWMPDFMILSVVGNQTCIVEKGERRRQGQEGRAVGWNACTRSTGGCCTTSRR